jgi:ubiquinone/menaquinone biosynthesis C-methylase UbiE
MSNEREIVTKQFVRANEEQHEEKKKISLYDRAHLKLISLVHVILYKFFVEPYKALRNAGLKERQQVLEVGCGPGFFTIPSAKIVGPNGRVYAIDINPAAVEAVRQKAEKIGLTNLSVFEADAARTGLPDQSIDIAFFFGVLHSIKNLQEVLKEIFRILREGSSLSVEKPHSWSERRLLGEVEKQGSFKFIEKQKEIYKFGKGPTANQNTSNTED